MPVLERLCQWPIGVLIPPPMLPNMSVCVDFGVSYEK